MRQETLTYTILIIRFVSLSIILIHQFIFQIWPLFLNSTSTSGLLEIFNHWFPASSLYALHLFTLIKDLIYLEFEETFLNALLRMRIVVKKFILHHNLGSLGAQFDFSDVVGE